MATNCKHSREVRSPTGKQILGTLEAIEGIALAVVTHNRAGKLCVQFDGETTVDWNSQVTQRNTAGARLFVDEEGAVWSEAQLQLKPTSLGSTKS